MAQLRLWVQANPLYSYIDHWFVFPNQQKRGISASTDISACALAHSSTKTTKGNSLSTATTAEPTASPTAKILISFYEYEEDEEAYQYQYRVYDGTPGQTVSFCGGAKLIAYVNIESDPSVDNYPTNQLPAFTTHGMKGCKYQSTSDKEAGVLKCPQWLKPVQCTVVPASERKAKSCPSVGSSIDETPIITCSWGPD